MSNKFLNQTVLDVEWLPTISIYDEEMRSIHWTTSYDNYFFNLFKTENMILSVVSELKLVFQILITHND